MDSGKWNHRKMGSLNSKGKVYKSWSGCFSRERFCCAKNIGSGSLECQATSLKQQTKGPLGTVRAFQRNHNFCSLVPNRNLDRCSRKW